MGFTSVLVLQLFKQSKPNWYIKIARTCRSLATHPFKNHHSKMDSYMLSYRKMHGRPC